VGVGFNSIYHITDTPSFITGDKYVILDPHEWYYDGGKKFSFIEFINAPIGRYNESIKSHSQAI
jgi:hypothetical protein